MKKIILFVIIMLTVTGCSLFSVEGKLRRKDYTVLYHYYGNVLKDKSGTCYLETDDQYQKTSCDVGPVYLDYDLHIKNNLEVNSLDDYVYPKATSSIIRITNLKTGKTIYMVDIQKDGSSMAEIHEREEYNQIKSLFLNKDKVNSYLLDEYNDYIYDDLSALEKKFKNKETIYNSLKEELEDKSFKIVDNRKNGYIKITDNNYDFAYFPAFGNISFHRHNDIENSVDLYKNYPNVHSVGIDVNHRGSICFYYPESERYTDNCSTNHLNSAKQLYSDMNHLYETVMSEQSIIWLLRYVYYYYQ